MTTTTQAPAVKTPEELAEIFRKAQAAANEYSNTEDGGTCNLDDIVFQPGRHAGRLGKAFKLLGWDWDSQSGFRWFGAKTYFARFSFSGQGNRRDRMSQAAYKSLREALGDDPIYVCHWQQMD